MLLHRIGNLLPQAFEVWRKFEVDRLAAEWSKIFNGFQSTPL